VGGGRACVHIYVRACLCEIFWRMHVHVRCICACVRVHVVACMQACTHELGTLALRTSACTCALAFELLLGTCMLAKELSILLACLLAC